MSGGKPHPDQSDLFADRVYPSRAPTTAVDVDRFRAKLKRAMSKAIRECPYDRHTVALRMGQQLGLEAVSKATIDAYTAESKQGHDISLVRFAAFVRATGATWLWDVVVDEEGLTMLVGDEARLAEIALLQQEQRELSAKLKLLRSVPVRISRKVDQE